jgi:hypothetical protein
MGSWQHAGRMLRGLRENRGWEVPRLAAELKAQATAIARHCLTVRASSG